MISTRDLWGWVISLGVIGSVILLSEILRRRGTARDVTRKIVHVGIGTWCVPTLYLFDHREAAVLLPAVFVVVNAWIHVTGRFPSLQDEDRSNLGTIWFPLSFTVLLYVFWSPATRGAAVAGLLVMAWADAAASLVGRRWGRHPYRIGRATKSLEGSAALALAVVPALAVADAVGSVGLPTLGYLLLPLAAVALEAPCARGLDNLLLPGGVALLYRLLAV
jgi:dolichol kinase